jgi:hypothetical protein
MITAWTVIREAVHAGHHRAQARGLPLGEPVVDGGGAGDGEERYVSALGLVRGIDAIAWRACSLKVLGVSRDRQGAVVMVVRDGEPQVRELDDREVARLLGIAAKRVQALITGACRQVYENYHRRQEAGLADAERGR